MSCSVRKKHITEIIAHLDKMLYNFINKILAIILGFIFISVLIIIITRVFNIFTYQVTGWYSLCTYAFVYASVLGATNLMIKGDHVSILLFYEKFNRTIKFFLSIINYILLIVIHFYILIYSLYWIKHTGKYIIVSLNMPRYPFQFALVLMSSLALLFSILKIIDIIFGSARELNLGSEEEER